jgi:hypothetical protein
MSEHNEFENSDQFIRRLRAEPGLPFSELLKVERVEQALEGLEIKYRDRVYPPMVTLWMFLSQVLSSDHSCRDAVCRLLAWRLSQGKSPCSIETASYCDARQELPLGLITKLTCDIGREAHQTADVSWKWKGRDVKVVDGTTATMPDTPENQAAFPRRRNQANGVGFPIARIVAVLSMAVGAALNLAIAPMRGKKTGETTLFRTIYQAFAPGDIALGDCLFASYRGIAELRKLNVDCLFRQHATRNTDFRRGRWLAVDDHIVVWKRPQFDRQRFERSEWEALPEEMLVREIRYQVTQSGFRTSEVILVTTLLDPTEYSREELSELYRMRWNAELDLRSIKTSMQMFHLRCKTPKMVEKEIWTHFLGYNLIRQTIAEAAHANAILPRQISFKGAVQAVNAFAPYFPLLRTQRELLWPQLLHAISTQRVGDRPDRIEPRKLKFRKGKYPLMTLPRNEERRRLYA